MYNGYAAEIIENNGFNLEIKNRNPVGHNDKLGTVHITAHKIWALAASTSSLTSKEFEISPPKELKGETPEKAGFVTVRINYATSQDRTRFDKTEDDDTVYWEPMVASSASEVNLLFGKKVKPSPNKKAEPPVVDKKDAVKKDDPNTPKADDSVSLLIEIVSCSGLLTSVQKSTDPYVRVHLDDIELHRTDFIPKT